jgi:predicted GNAT family N-acyltransferase
MLSFRFFPGTDPEIILALDIRRQVFVEEQCIAPELEADDYDFIAWHLLALEDEQPIGTARLVTLDALTVKIGRVAVLPAHRGRGIARQMMNMLLEYSKREGFKEVVVDAQLEVIGFYLKLGFTPKDPIFIDAGIPHQRMILEI